MKKKHTNDAQREVLRALLKLTKKDPRCLYTSSVIAFETSPGPYGHIDLSDVKGLLETYVEEGGSGLVKKIRIKQSHAYSESFKVAYQANMERISEIERLLH